MAVGRSTEPRVITAGITNTDATVTAAAGTFHEEDAGRTVTGTGIPASTTVLSVTSDTALELSASATATNASASLTLGAGDAQDYGFSGWSPETDLESESYSVAAVNAGTNVPPSVLDDDTTRVEQRVRTAS